MPYKKYILLFLAIMVSANYLLAKPKKKSWLDEAANEVKSSRSEEGNLQIDRTLEFEPSLFNSKIRNKLPDIANMRKNANKTVTEKQYDKLGILINEKTVLENKTSVATDTEEIKVLSERLKDINNKIQLLMEEKKRQASNTENLLDIIKK